jgi:hypothetical protein
VGWFESEYYEGYILGGIKVDKQIIKNKRVKNYLYSMGFDFKQEFTENGDMIYLFEKSNLLYDAINFYNNFKKRKLELEHR